MRRRRGAAIANVSRRGALKALAAGGLALAWQWPIARGARGAYPTGAAALPHGVASDPKVGVFAMALVVPAVATLTFSRTMKGGCPSAGALVTLVNVPVIFRSWMPAPLVAMLTLSRLTFRTQDSGKPAMPLAAVAPVAFRPEMVMSRMFGVSAVIARGGSLAGSAGSPAAGSYALITNGCRTLARA